MSMMEPWMDDEDDDPDCCHHGIGFDEECAECEEEDELLDSYVDAGVEEE